MSIDDLLTEWHVAAEQLSQATQRERELRTQIFEQAFPKPVVGTNKTRLNHGMALLGTYRMNHKLDEKVLDILKPKIPTALFGEVIKYKASVRDSAYAKLNPTQARLFAPAITSTPGLCAIEIKPADKVRW